MTAQKWLIFIVSLIIVMAMLACVDTIFAGVLYCITLLFEKREALIVFKWVFRGLLCIEIPIIVPLLYHSVKKEGGNESGT